MSNDLSNLKSQCDSAFDVAQQKQNYLEVCRARQTMAYNNGIFFVDHNLIGFLRALKESNTVESIVLDHNNNPIRVNVQSLLEKSIERYQESVNSYEQLYQQLIKRV